MSDIRKTGRQTHARALRVPAAWTYFLVIVCVSPVTWATGAAHRPDGYREVAWLKADEGPVSVVNLESITLGEGRHESLESADAPFQDAFTDEDRVTLFIEGLDAEAAYVLELVWWNSEGTGEKQSVSFISGEESEPLRVLPPTPARAFVGDASTWARLFLPLDRTYRPGGAVQVSVFNEDGTQAVLNEARLLRRDGAPPQARALVVTGDDYAGHDWRTTAPAFAALLRADPRFEVTITECPAILGSPLLAHYDLVIVHFKNYADRLPVDPACHGGLTAHLASGRGLILSHFGCGAFQEWPGFVRLAGRVWNPALRAHDPHGAFTVRVTDIPHPITAGMGDFVVTDELYTCLDGDAPITVLCEATSIVDGETYPMAFTVEGTGGRVFHSVLGHDTQAYASPGVRQLYLRGALWAAGIALD